MGGTVSLYDVLKARKTGLSPDLYTLLRAQREMSERVITAEPPIYFKSYGTALSEYQINGDTVQNETPTPDNPVEVLGVGDRVVNHEPYSYKISITLNSVTQNVYLDKPLYSGDYIKLNADGSGVVHRELKKLVLTGEEEWIASQAVTGGYYSSAIPNDYLKITVITTVCTHFNTIRNSSSLLGMDYGTLRLYAPLQSSSAHEIYIRMDMASVSDFKSYLAEQYAAGTPVTVYYQLATPTDTPIALPQLSTVKGNNELNISTTVTPEVTLKGKIKQLPDSDMNALLSVMEVM